MHRIFVIGSVASAFLFAGGGVALAQLRGLDVELVDQRIAALRASGTPSDNETLTTYEQVRGLLNESDSDAREAATYTESLTSAPQREAEFERRLDELDEAYDPAREIEGLNAEEQRARHAQASAEQRELQSRRETLDRRLAARATNAAAIPARLAEIDRRLDALPAMDFTLDPGALPSLAEARQWRNAAEAGALAAERRATEAERASQPVRYSAMTAERAELTLELERLAALIRELETRLATTAQTAAESAELGIERTDPAYAVAAALVASNAELGRELIRVNERLAGVRAAISEIARSARALAERSATARRIATYGGSEALGEVLLRYWSELDDYVVADPTDRLSRDMGRAIMRGINYDETLSGLVSASGFVNQRLRDAGVEPASVSAGTRAALLELAQAYRERVRAVLAAETDYVRAVGELETGYSALTAQVDDYQRFLEGRILWIPNQPPLWTVEPGAFLTDVERFAATVGTIRFVPGLELGLAVLALLLLAHRRRLLALQQSGNSAIWRPQDDSIRHSLVALGAAALRVAPAPILLLALAGVVDTSGSAVGERLRDLLYQLALVLFAFSLMRAISEPSGIGRIHFGWRSTTMDRVHAELTFLIRIWLPLAFAAALANRLAPFAEGATIARPLMVVAMLMLAVHFGWYQVREIRNAGRAWFGSGYNRWRVLLALVFFALTGAIVYGQGFSVTVMVGCLVNTALAGGLLLLVHAFLMRWLKLTRLRLRVQELQTPKAAQPTEEAGSVEEQVADVGDVSAATAQLVNAATIVGAAIAALYIWEPLLPALAAFDAVELWTSTSIVNGETVVNRFTLATVLNVLVLVGLTVFAAQRLPAVVEIALRSRTSVSAGTRYAASTLLNYVIIGAGIVAALSALGLKWAQLQWLVAALGVGIGFGLQEIVANFISGIIILFERPVRVGDIVTVGDKEGTVTRIRIRATTIRDWDGKELLVPNKEFITGRLLNWTLSDTQTRIIIPVGIAYGSDVERALQILRDVVLAHPRTLKEPAPLIVFENFGESALELSARCFLDSVDQRLTVMTELRMAMSRALQEAGIAIAFPQRDVHLDTSRPLRIALESASVAETRGRIEKVSPAAR